MKATGHKTLSMFHRYNAVGDDDLRALVGKTKMDSHNLGTSTPGGFLIPLLTPKIKTSESHPYPILVELWDSDLSTKLVACERECP